MRTGKFVIRLRVLAASAPLLAWAVAFADDCTFTVAKKDACPDPPVTTLCKSCNPNTACPDCAENKKAQDRFTFETTPSRTKAVATEVEQLCYTNYFCKDRPPNSITPRCIPDISTAVLFYRQVYTTEDCER